MPANPTFKKREKERLRLERQRDKDAKRKMRREEKKDQANAPGGGTEDESGVLPEQRGEEAPPEAP
ncbi:MAG TPA: hypothetical protein VJT73_08665 [Polyangiaceae bacterium]|nr:hypothetical protein [Polyangiaceae bacterium]